eukprot:3889626-Amphidinium_carterae.2
MEKVAKILSFSHGFTVSRVSGTPKYVLKNPILESYLSLGEDSSFLAALLIVSAGLAQQGLHWDHSPYGQGCDAVPAHLVCAGSLRIVATGQGPSVQEWARCRFRNASPMSKEIDEPCTRSIYPELLCFLIAPIRKKFPFFGKMGVFSQQSVLLAVQRPPLRRSSRRSATTSQAGSRSTPCEIQTQMKATRPKRDVPPPPPQTVPPGQKREKNTHHPKHQQRALGRWRWCKFVVPTGGSRSLKRRRRSGHSLGTEAAVNTEVASAQSSRPEDKTAILKHIAGREKELDLAIHGRFARSAVDSFVQGGETEKVMSLLREVPELLNAGLNKSGATPLYTAIEKTHVEVVSALIAAKADVDKARTNDGTTPLHIAAQDNHVEVVSALIAAKADVDKTKTDGHGATPLNIAAFHNHVEVVNALIAAKADVNQATTDYGTTPLYIAAKKNHVETVSALIAAKADVNQATTDLGATPLHIAAQKNHVEVVNVLIAAKADVNQAMTETGATPLDYVAGRKVAQQLRKAGATKGAD